MSSAIRMHQKPRRTLATIVKRHGDELIDDPRRTQALLNDLCGRYTREIFVLVQAQRKRVPAELRAAPAWLPLSTTINRLIQSLEDQLALTPEAATWAVESWAIALGLRAEEPALPWYQRWPAGLWGESDQSAKPAPTSASSAGDQAGTVAAPAAAVTKTAASSPSPAATVGDNTKSPLFRSTRQNAANGVQSKANPGWGHRFSLQRAPRTAPSASTGNRPNPRNGLARLPRYLRQQAPSVLLWTTVFLISLSLGWAMWDGAAVSLDLSTPTAASTTPAVVATQTAAPTPNRTPVAGFALLNTLYPPPQQATVTAVDGLRVRAAPSLDALNIDLLPYQQTVTVAEFSPDGLWARLTGTQPGAQVGWVSTQYLALASEQADAVQIRLQTGRITSQLGPIELRSAPRVDAATTEQLSPGTTVIVIAATINGQWLQVSTPTPGWVLASAVEFSGASDPSAVGRR